VHEDRLQRLAELAVRFGANLQPGQIISIGCEPGKEDLVRAMAGVAYRDGAKFVDVSWFDPWVKRARIAHAPDDSLDYVPPWYGERMLALGRERAARVALSGPTAPGILDGLDPERAGRDRLPAVKESLEVANRREVNWTVVPCPTPAWAQLVYPDVDAGDALERLWSAIERVCRLDEDDPVGAWRERIDTLVGVAGRLTDRAFDSLHYQAPGTDLTVGLLRGVRWAAARMETADGLEHMPNLPTEEVFTCPDPARVDGVVTSTKPLVLIDGTVVRDLVVRFEGGRIAELTASSGQDVMRTIVARDEGASRLGEIALVDGEGRIGALDTVFYDTLLDENAASHLAIGTGFPFLAEDADPEEINRSEIHIDFMIGSPDMTVTGITMTGERVPVLEGGRWRI
jgi:aminopeptidase